MCTSSLCYSAAVWCNCRCCGSWDLVMLSTVSSLWVRELLLTQFHKWGNWVRGGAPWLTSIRWKPMAKETLDMSPSNASVGSMHLAPLPTVRWPPPPFETCHVTTTPLCFFSRWKRQLNKTTIRCFHVNKIVWTLGRAIGRRQLPAGIGKDWYYDAWIRFAKTLMHLNINKLPTAMKGWLQDMTKHTKSQKGFLRFRKGRGYFPFAGTVKSIYIWPKELHIYIYIYERKMVESSGKAITKIKIC